MYVLIITHARLQNKERQMYIGVGAEKGKEVTDEDAFCYACACCKDGDADMQEEFLYMARHSGSMAEFSRDLEEWFFSGSWCYRRDDEIGEDWGSYPDDWTTYHVRR